MNQYLEKKINLILWNWEITFFTDIFWGNWKVYRLKCLEFYAFEHIIVVKSNHWYSMIFETKLWNFKAFKNGIYLSLHKTITLWIKFVNYVFYEFGNQKKCYFEQKYGFFYTNTLVTNFQWKIL